MFISVYILDEFLVTKNRSLCLFAALISFFFFIFD